MTPAHTPDQNTGPFGTDRTLRGIVFESAVNLLSPQMAINTLIQRVHTSPGATLDDTFGRIWSSVAALTIYPIVFFVVAYTRFLWMDIR